MRKAISAIKHWLMKLDFPVRLFGTFFWVRTIQKERDYHRKHRQDDSAQADFRAPARNRARYGARARRGARAGGRAGSGLTGTDPYGNSFPAVLSPGFGIVQNAGGTTLFYGGARRNGKTNFAAAVSYMQAKYGGAPLTQWQLRVLDSLAGPDGQEGFVMVMDDGSVEPVPLPGLEAEDGSGYARGGVIAGPVTAQQIASSPVTSSYPPQSVSVNTAQVTAAFGVQPGLVAASLAAPSGQPAQPGPPGRRVLQPGSRKHGTAAYARGMNGFDGRGVIPEEDPPDLPAEIPDVYGVVRGFRWWTLDAPPLHMSPARAGQVWPRKLLRGMQAEWDAGENRAVCRAGAHSMHPEQTVPDENCACGFWAYWELQRHEVGGRALPVCGVVEGYGAVLIGEKGFRAAKARIVALHLPFTIQPAAEADDDPLGLGLPQHSYAPRTPGGQRNPWPNHPQFTGSVHYMPGYDPDTGEYYDPAAGAPAAGAPVPDLAEPSADERQAARDAAEAWMAVIGDRLEQMYPGAQVFETRNAMEKTFPPDRSYVPAPGQCTCDSNSPIAYIGSNGHAVGCPLAG